MRKFALNLSLLVLLAACADGPPLVSKGAPQDVEVLGRNWRVTRIAQTPPTYWAARWLVGAEYNPFGASPTIKTVQAITAIEAATGCKVDRSSLSRDVGDYFYAQVICGENRAPLM